MGVPFNFKHMNSHIFFDQDFNETVATTKKPVTNKKQRRSSGFENIPFSFKTLDQLDLPLTENRDQNNGEFNHNGNEQENLDFLGKVIPDIPSSKGGKARLTERLIGSLSPEQSTSSNTSIARSAP